MSVAICPAVLTDGFCLTAGCNLQHDTSNFCFICNQSLNTAAVYNQHVKTPAHFQNESTSQWLKCIPCDRHYIWGTPTHTAHERSSAHLQKVAAYTATEDAVVQIPAPPNHTRCDACNVVFTASLFIQHCRTQGHITRQRILDYRDALLRTQANQRGIEVSGPQDGLDLGTQPHTTNPLPMTSTVSVTRVGPAEVSLTRARTLSSLGAQPGVNLCFTVTTVQLPIAITPQSDLPIHIHFNPHGQRGRFEDRLELVFREPNGSTFIITRPLKAAVANQDLATLAPTQPYTRPRRGRQGQEKKVIKGGEDPDSLIKYKRKLNIGKIPEGMETVLQQGSVDEQIRIFRERFMPAALDIATFQQYWSNLVHAEHHQAKNDLSHFNIENVTIASVGRLYEPSVLTGDRIKLHPHNAGDGVWFEGVIRHAENAAVRMSFHPTFPFNAGARYDVKFMLNPVPFHRMLHALQVTPKRENLLFPQPEHMQAGASTVPATNAANPELYNDAIGSNAEQLQAVRRIVQLPPGSPPFVVFGPPGTGKTVTIVEGICQLLNNKGKTRVLACAPSNSASDLIAWRLINIIGLQPSQLFRLNATRRPMRDLPDTLVPYSLHDGERFTVPSPETLNSYQIIIATCSSSASLYGFEVDPGSFTHIFIDEAGQGMEPEIMIPIMTMAGPNTNVVLSGDPKQLGPVIHSPVARPLGLRKSYLQRLMDSPAYDEVTMRGISVAKLLQNFRSHNAILAFPNREFYSNELIPRAPAPIANSLLNSGWNGFGAPNFLVIFEAVAGEDMREATSPSYFNPHEASVVKDYVQSLVPFVAPTSNIGIVTPYRGQVRKIKALLREINITDIEVASVEQFQGQERQVIIVSTVRSSRDLISFDLRHTLGFVANNQRLNVAVTRAQALLVVVGDPQVLGLDRLWRRFMYDVNSHGGWKGAPFPWDPNADPDDAGVTADLAEQEVIELLRRTGMRGNNDGSDDPDELDHVGGTGN